MTKVYIVVELCPLDGLVRIRRVFQALSAAEEYLQYLSKHDILAKIEEFKVADSVERT